MTTASFYGNAHTSAWNKEVDWDSDQIKVMLCSSAYVPNKDTHRYLSHVTNEVPAGGGYTAGGLVLPTPNLVYDAANDRLRLAGGTAQWNPLTLAAPGARYAVVYDNTPATAATKPLILWVDYEQDLTPVNGILSLAPNALGWAYTNT